MAALRWEPASISGVAASQVVVGPPRFGSMRSVVRLLERLSNLGARPEDSDDERLRHGTLIFASMLITLISVIWVATYFAYGYPISAAIPASYQLITVIGSSCWRGRGGSRCFAPHSSSHS